MPPLHRPTHLGPCPGARLLQSIGAGEVFDLRPRWRGRPRASHDGRAAPERLTRRGTSGRAGAGGLSHAYTRAQRSTKSGRSPPPRDLPQIALRAPSRRLPPGRRWAISSRAARIWGSRVALESRQRFARHRPEHTVCRPPSSRSLHTGQGEPSRDGRAGVRTPSGRVGEAVTGSRLQAARDVRGGERVGLVWDSQGLKGPIRPTSIGRILPGSSWPRALEVPLCHGVTSDQWMVPPG